MCKARAKQASTLGLFSSRLKLLTVSASQVMVMVGIAPVADALGRVNKLEVVPLEQLGRPRVDVVVNCSGVFRDLFVNQVCGGPQCRAVPVQPAAALLAPPAHAQVLLVPVSGQSIALCT